MFRVLCLQGGGVFVGGGTVAISSCTISGNTAGQVHAHVRKFPLPHGRLTFDCCLQGGGVFVGGGTVTFSSCTISGNQASYVRGLTLKSSHHPDGKIADVLALILACTTATDASVN